MFLSGFGKNLGNTIIMAVAITFVVGFLINYIGLVRTSVVVALVSVVLLLHSYLPSAANTETEPAD